MNRVNVLVDLGNTDSFRAVARPNPSLVAHGIDSLIERVVGGLLPHYNGKLFEIKLRLYHGWFHADGRSTDLHVLAASHARRAYPTRQRAVRLFLDLAEGPVAIAGVRIAHTFRVEAGLPRVSVEQTEGSPVDCAAPLECGVLALRQWLRGRCSRSDLRCSAALEDVVQHRKQKLVDTALVADLVWLASQGEDVAAVSDDEDVLPGLLTASSHGVSVMWLCRGGRPRPPYLDVVTHQRIRCVSC